MASATYSSLELAAKLEQAKEAAQEGPVFIADDERSTHVLLNIEDYRKISGTGLTLYEALYSSKLAAVDPDFEFSKIELDPKPVEFD